MREISEVYSDQYVNPEKDKREERKMRRLMGLALGFLLLFGCMGKGYWMVNDPYTKTVYYTRQLDILSSGTATFTDAQTGKMVHIQNSEAKNITEDEFKAAVAKKGEVKPAEPKPAEPEKKAEEIKPAETQPAETTPEKK